jgi:hypothetical protein
MQQIKAKGIIKSTNLVEYDDRTGKAFNAQKILSKKKESYFRSSLSPN